MVMIDWLMMMLMMMVVVVMTMMMMIMIMIMMMIGILIMFKTMTMKSFNASTEISYVSQLFGRVERHHLWEDYENVTNRGAARFRQVLSVIFILHDGIELKALYMYMCIIINIISILYSQGPIQLAIKQASSPTHILPQHVNDFKLVKREKTLSFTQVFTRFEYQSCLIWIAMQWLPITVPEWLRRLLKLLVCASTPQTLLSLTHFLWSFSVSI